MQLGEYAVEKFYLLTLSRSSATIEKISGGATTKTKVLETASAKKLLQKSVAGFYFRLKVRQEYTQIGLYEAGDNDASEPIVSYKV